MLPNDPAFPNHLRWNLTAAQIEEGASKLIEASKKALDEIAKLEPSWNLLLKLNDEDALVATIAASFTYPGQVSADKTIRDAAEEAEKKINAYDIEKTFRQDIYQLVKAYAKIHDRSKFNAIDNRFLDKLLEIYERNGLGLAADKQARLKDVKTEISNLSITFEKNVNEDTSFLLFTKEELEGMSDTFINGLEMVGDKYKVTIQMPHYFGIMKSAKNPDTRSRLEHVKDSQCMAVNPQILEKIVLLRQEEASLLGFKNYADYCIAPKMAKDSDTVLKFLSALIDKTNDALARDFESIRALKKEEMEQRGLPYDPTIYSYDFRYYIRMIDEKKYNLDQDLISQYFPVDHVTNEMLKIFQEVLGLVFKPCPNPHVWHEDAVQYEVYDSATNAFMGQFTMDLYPREGKYGHAAVWDNQKACVIDGKRQYPCPALVCNFPKPTPGVPALLFHDDVNTFFHEFGHAMHQICSTVPYALISGTSVQRDFVETPSQMLENWVYEKVILERLSKHVETGATLPESIRQQLVAARVSCSAVLMRRQLFFGIFDMTLHMAKGPVDTQALYNKLRVEVSGAQGQNDTNGSASFAHLVGGYAAGYYGYLWSEVFSFDLFSVFQKNGVLDKATGKRYRDIILAPGGSREASELLCEFLGREPSQEAFLIGTGLKQKCYEEMNPHYPLQPIKRSVFLSL